MIIDTPQQLTIGVNTMNNSYIHALHTFTIILSMAPGYEMAMLGFFGLDVLMTKFSGNDAGKTHQIPSVSSSRGRLKQKKTSYKSIEI
jgi:hypothetical protein